MFDSPEIDEFHKTVGLTPLYRGKSHKKKLIAIYFRSTVNNQEKTGG